MSTRLAGAVAQVLRLTLVRDDVALPRVQMNCKVYGWVKGSWQERGRGILRLNDWGSGGVELHSRLVVRTQGTLTIMLNTNIWSEMSVEKASNKSVRFTASDPDGQTKIYLVMVTYLYRNTFTDANTCCPDVLYSLLER